MTTAPAKTQTPKKAIVTTYHGATATRPNRISAKDADNNRATVAYDDIPSALEWGAPRHRFAAEALCRKMNWDSSTLIAGYLGGSSWVFVFNE